METNLRPMSLGEILDRTAQLYRSNFVLFAGIAAVYAGAMLVLNLAQVGMQEILRAHNMTQQVPWVGKGERDYCRSCFECVAEGIGIQRLWNVVDRERPAR